MIAFPPACLQGRIRPLSHRAQARWSTLLTGRNSRIAEVMKSSLGSHQWESFVAYANWHYKPQFVAAFSRPIHCQGKIGSATGCPFNVGISNPECGSRTDHTILGHLHLDHNVELHRILEVWQQIRGRYPHGAAWDCGIDRGMLCHLLFGVTERSGMPANLYFRCGNANNSRLRWAFCHEQTRPHSMFGLCEADLACQHTRTT